MKARTIVTGAVAAVVLAGGAYAALTLNSSAAESSESGAVAPELASAAEAPRAPRRAMAVQRQPTPPPESTRVYVDPSTRLQTGPDGVTPLHYDCSFQNGQVQECWCDTPLDCKDMILNSPCTEDDAWWTSGEDTLGCTIQD